MRKLQRALGVWVVLIAGVLSATPAVAVQCVAYARSVTGAELRGDAWRWWEEARERYARGAKPAPGAVLVFKKTVHMSRGHVAVVQDVVSSREIIVDHANWSRPGRVAQGVRVIDTSPDNDWSAVRVEGRATEAFGRSYPTYGFIYVDAPAAPARFQVASFDPSPVDSTLPNLGIPAVAEDLYPEGDWADAYAEE